MQAQSILHMRPGTLIEAATVASTDAIRPGDFGTFLFAVQRGAGVHCAVRWDSGEYEPLSVPPDDFVLLVENDADAPRIPRAASAIGGLLMLWLILAIALPYTAGGF